MKKSSIIVMLLSVCIAGGISYPALSAGDWSEASPGGSSPGERHLHCLAYDPSHEVIGLYGGDDMTAYITDVYIYDGYWWIEVPPDNAPPDGRDSPAMAHIHSSTFGIDGFFIFGGFNNSKTVLNDGWIFTYTMVPLQGHWAPMEDYWTGCSPSDYPPPREGHSLVYNPDNDTLILFGGRDGATYYNDVWIFDPSADTVDCPWSQQTTPAIAPYGRAFHGACFDELRGVMVIFGGDGPPGSPSSTKFDDTWEYNPDSNYWVQIDCGAIHPDYLEKMAMSFDSETGLAILFGGKTPDTKENKVPLPKDIYNETWEYDWTVPRWRLVSTTTDPDARFETAMAYFKTTAGSSGRHVLYGGTNYSYTLVSDTWEFTAELTPTPTVTPPPIPATGSTGNITIILILSLIIVLLSTRSRS